MLITINNFRSFVTPPEPVQIVSECVAMLRGVRDVSWKGAKGLMSDPGFLKSLQEMNCDQITLKQQQAVRAHLKKSDKLDQMQVISKAGYGLYRFVLAVLDYCAVFREVFAEFCVYDLKIFDLISKQFIRTILFFFFYYFYSSSYLFYFFFLKIIIISFYFLVICRYR